MDLKEFVSLGSKEQLGRERTECRLCQHFDDKIHVEIIKGSGGAFWLGVHGSR